MMLVPTLARTLARNSEVAIVVLRYKYNPSRWTWHKRDKIAGLEDRDLSTKGESAPENAPLEVSPRVKGVDCEGQVLSLIESHEEQQRYSGNTPATPELLTARHRQWRDQASGRQGVRQTSTRMAAR